MSGINKNNIIELHGNSTYAKCLNCNTRYELNYIKDYLEASLTTEYTDPGAKCIDLEDGNLSHAIEVSDQVVNMRLPGKYVIKYDCKDSNGRYAESRYRTVFIRKPLRHHFFK